jgi:hypothetical protein
LIRVLADMESAPTVIDIIYLNNPYFNHFHL